MTTFDVAIIGGGLIGASIAFELASEDLRIVVLDRQQPGREASWAAAGMLSPAPDSPRDHPLIPFAKRSLRMYADFVAEVEEASGRQTGYRRAGTIEIFGGSDGEAERDAMLAEHRQFGLAAEFISLTDARNLEPSIGPGARTAAWLPDEASVEPRPLVEAVLSAAYSRGVDVRSSARVTSLLFEGEADSRVSSKGYGASRCVGVLTGGERISAKHVVVAAGSFSAEIGRENSLQAPNGSTVTAELLSRYAPVKPVRGQMLALRAKSALLQHVLRSRKGYLVPRADGRIVAGSTIENAGFEKRVTAAGVRQIIEGALQMLPALADAEILETWSGLRPGTPDDLPIIGAAETEGLIFATGHYRNGILLAPVTAKIVKDCIIRGGSTIDFTPLSPLRFSDRAFHTAR